MLIATRDQLQRLAAQDPGNAEWQRDLSVSRDKVGDVLVAQGNGAGALAAYRASLGIRERLAAQDPGNAAWQRDLVVSCFQLARASDEADAFPYWRRCHATLRAMVRSRMDLDPLLEQLLQQLDAALGSR